MFLLDAVGFSAGKRRLLEGISLQFDKGRVYGLIGHNGSGKSTLLKLLARQYTPDTGRITLDGEGTGTYTPRAYAAKVAYLPQQLPPAGGLSGRELVSMGRYSATGLVGRMQAHDKAAVERAMDFTGTALFADRPADHLSGGERARVWLAMCLAQESRFLLLDEPLAALDVRHQIEVMDLICRLSRELDLGVVMVMHDINLAARYCDDMVALHGGRLLKTGTPSEMMTSEMLFEIYGVEMTITRHPLTGDVVALP